mmetsp:Transcript_8199/g.22746  ORF Transcript_8199/g.22746 Transcript_8199/m.22746 type:complete len:244 (+) Transcript_8199:1005-1736(+)
MYTFTNWPIASEPFRGFSSCYSRSFSAAARTGPKTTFGIKIGPFTLASPFPAWWEFLWPISFRDLSVWRRPKRWPFPLNAAIKTRALLPAWPLPCIKTRKIAPWPLRCLFFMASWKPWPFVCTASGLGRWVGPRRRPMRDSAPLLAKHMRWRRKAKTTRTRRIMIKRTIGPKRAKPHYHLGSPMNKVSEVSQASNNNNNSKSEYGSGNAGWAAIPMPQQPPITTTTTTTLTPLHRVSSNTSRR